MNIQSLIQQIKAFYLRHRTVILIGFAFVVLMQICSRGAEVSNRREPVAIGQQEEWSQDGVSIKPLAEIEREHQRDQQLPGTASLVVMMVLVLVFYVGVKKGWFLKLIPSIVWVSLRLHRNKQTRHQMLKISILNQAKESHTFLAPILAFGSPFKKSRKFRIKGGDGQDVFPITLTPGTAHQLTLDFDQFRHKVGKLEKYRWVRMEVEASGEKNFKSFWKPVW